MTGLSEILRQHQKEITTRWLDGIRRLPLAQRVTERELEDTIPQVVNELFELLDQTLARLERGERPSFRTPIEHGRARRLQRLDILDVLAEYRIFREIVVQYVEGGKIDPRALSALHSSIDQAITDAVQVFHEEVLAELKDAVQARENLIAVAAHDLRDPLCAFSFELEVLKIECDGDQISPDQIIERLRGLQERIKNVTGLLNRLLDCSQIAAGKLQLRREKAALSEIVGAAFQRVESGAARSGSQLQLKLWGPIVGEWDRNRVEDAVANLLSNALKFSGHQPVEVSVHMEGDEAVVAVRDYGIGIPLEQQSKIFDRFERAASSAEYSGSGLGLWIAREVVEAHRGTIEVESEPGRGSLFTLRLPLYQDGLEP